MKEPPANAMHGSLSQDPMIQEILSLKRDLDLVKGEVERLMYVKGELDCLEKDKYRQLILPLLERDRFVHERLDGVALLSTPQPEKIMEDPK